MKKESLGDMCRESSQFIAMKLIKIISRNCFGTGMWGTIVETSHDIDICPKFGPQNGIWRCSLKSNFAFRMDVLLYYPQNGILRAMRTIERDE